MDKLMLMEIYKFKTDGSPSNYGPSCPTYSGIQARSGKITGKFFMLEPQSGQTTVEVHASNAMAATIDTSSTVSKSLDTGYSSIAEIGSFLERKVQIHTQTWAVGGDFAASIHPWQLFLNNPAVLKKINNFAMIKGDLMITILINGTPFHAGILLASYAYMDETNETITIGGDTQAVTRSQRPHLYLNASTCKGGCICAPFFWPYNFYNLVDGEHTPSEIGRLDIGSFRTLAQINGGVDSVTVTVFAHMVNVKLTVPTMAPTVAMSDISDIDFNHYFCTEPQSDEHPDKGVLSGPASAIASYAGMLSSAPVIGPLAMATQIGASAVASIARLFGYSKPVNLDNISPMRNFPISSLALVEGSDSSQKLTLTGKQEISIDPSTCGLTSEDTLSISAMATRESYLTQFEWGVTDTVSSSIFAIRVDPAADRRSSSGTSGIQIIPTSLSCTVRPFTNWSGTLKYRFQVMASQYHRGRLAVIYDPHGPLSGDPYNITYNTIIDMAEGRDFTIEVPWQQDRPYADVDSFGVPTFYTETLPATLTSNSYDNGVLYIVVVNELVVPDGTTPATILVSVSAGDDFEVMNPSGFLDRYMLEPMSATDDISFDSYFSLETQSSTEVVPEQENSAEGEANMIQLIPQVISRVDEKAMIFYGERIMSFRQLLKRYVFYRSYAYQSATTTPFALRMGFRAFPGNRGSNPNGPDTTTLAAPYNYAGMPYMCYLRRCYAGWRGSVRWKLLQNTNSKITTVTRYTGRPFGVVGAFAYVAESLANTLTTSTIAYNKYLSNKETASGMALTMNHTQEGLEVEVPYAFPFRFSKTSLGHDLLSSYDDFSPTGDLVGVGTVTEVSRAATLTDTFVAAGEDFTFFGWIGAPVIYYQGVTPLPS